MLHSYMRSLGCVTTVLWITVVGSVTRLIATLLLIPLIHIDGVFLGQVISWAVDGALSIILWLALYRTCEQLTRLIRRAHGT